MNERLFQGKMICNSREKVYAKISEREICQGLKKKGIMGMTNDNLIFIFLSGPRHQMSG